MSIFATGNNTQAYVGVRAPTPPNMNLFQRDPNNTDKFGYVVGDFWQNFNTQHTFILTSLAGNVANWSLIDAAAGDVTNFTTGDGNTVLPNVGNIDLPNTTNINTTGIPNLGNIIQINLNNSILLPATTADQLNGVISIGGTPAFHEFNSASNIFVGSNAGNFTLIGTANTGVGQSALHALSTGLFNTAIGNSAGTTLTVGQQNTFLGYGAGLVLTSGNSNVGLGYLSLSLLTTSNDNTAIGWASLGSLDTGVNNIALGFLAGSNYSTNESNNIAIGNDGVILDSRVIRIGTNVTQTSCYIAGIDGVDVGNVSKVVTENNDQLGTATITAGSGITVTPTANTITIAANGTIGTNINLPNTNTGGTQGVIEWNSLSYIHNYIFAGLSHNFFSGLFAGNTAATLTGNNNSAFGFAAGNVLTSGGNNTFLGGQAGQSIMTGSINTAIGFNSLGAATTGGGNITIGYNAASLYTGAESDNIIIGNLGVNAESGIIRIGTNGIHTNSYIAGLLTNQLGITSSLGDITATSGNMIITAGNLTLPNTNIGGTAGVITIGGVPWIHEFGGADNTFVGGAAGNTLVTLIGSNNTGLGNQALMSITSGGNNTAVGFGAGLLVSGGTNNTSLGYGAGSSIQNNSNNIHIGNAGVALDAGVIKIGTIATHTTCYIAGIAGVTTTVNDAVPVLISASTSQLGTVSSSKRYKDNIQDMCCESANVMHLKPVTFTYKSDPTYKLQYGLIAEEVAEVMPRLVIYNADGSPETVKYHELPVLLLNEIQKLNDRINVLEKKLEMV